MQRGRRLGIAATLSLALILLAAPAAGAVTGLEGDYYVSSADGAFDFHELKATALDPNIDFDDLEPALRALTGQNDNAAVRWTGEIEPRYSETYTFSMIGDNGFRLWVNDQLIIDHWVDDWEREQIGTPIALQAGRRYAFKVEFFEHFGGSNLHLSWSSPSQPKEIVPKSAFSVPQYDGPTSATVSPDGKTVTLGIDEALSADNLTIAVNYTPWPIASVARDGSNVLVRLAEPIPQKAGDTVRAIYDGVPAFNRFVDNQSTHQIETRWAKEVSPSNALPAYPRPQLTRPRWRSLNGTWELQAGGRSDPILVPYPPESRLSGIERHFEEMRYRRTFTVPPEWLGRRDERLLLHFGAVDHEAAVYVNGTLVATHKGGYDAFDVDVTDALRRHGPQELMVEVSDPTDDGTINQAIGKQRVNPSGIWYTATSGIWQTVWMEPVSRAHVERLDLTPSPQDQTLRLSAITGAGDQRVTATAYDGNRRVGAVTGPANRELALPVPDPKLWSPERPFLYKLRVTLSEGGRELDSVGSYFGMRSIAVGTAAGQPHLMLNGDFVFHLGTLDQGFWPDGIYTAPTDAALRSDLVVQKALGFNTVRKHVKVEPARWYYWADRLGLLVWQDMPSMEPGQPVSAADRTQFETELRALVDQHKSHPSIVMWVPFNEGWGEYDTARIADQVKAWDPSRPVNANSGMNCCLSLPDTGAGDVYDNHTYVGPGVVTPTDDRAVVDGEFGGLGLNVLGHTWAGFGFAYETESNAAQLNDRYVQLLEQVRDLEIRCGLSGAIYTQPYDVEMELNGLLTYDREVVKVDARRVREVNRSVLDAAADLQPGPCPTQSRSAETPHATPRPLR